MLAGTDDHLTWLSPVILNLESKGLSHLESEIRVDTEVGGERLSTALQFYSFPTIERKTPDGLTGELVNGDHLSIPGMRDYSYTSLGAYNQMLPSPKTTAPQSPSNAALSYTLGKNRYAWRTYISC